MVSSRPARRPTELNRQLALLVAGAFFMENLDGTIIATAASAMAADLGVGAVDINVAITAYLVTIAVGSRSVVGSPTDSALQDARDDQLAPVLAPGLRLHGSGDEVAGR